MTTARILRLSPAALALLVMLAAPGRAVVLDGNNRCTVKLLDGSDVVLYGEYKSTIGGPSQLSALTGRGAGGTETSEAATDGSELLQDQALVPLSSARFYGRAAFPAPSVVARGDDPQKQSIERFDEAKKKRDALQAVIAARREKNRPPAFNEYTQSKRYYYLPPGNSLRLSKRPDGVPEFLFVKYTTDERAEAGGVQGGLFHFLMEWSLTPLQELELRARVKASCKTNKGEAGELVGAVEVEEAEEKGSFQIISATLSDTGMTRTLVKSGHAPTLPGGKIAAAANLSAQGAQLFLATVEDARSVADLSVELDFKYNVMLPGAKGKITFYWDKMKEMQESMEAEFRKEHAAYDKNGCWWFICSGSAKYNFTDTEVSSLFSTMMERNIVTIQYEGYQPDSEYNKAIIQAMLDFFTQSLMEPGDNAGGFSEAPPAGGEEGEEVNRRPANARSYVFKRDRLESAFASKQQEVSLEFGVAVKRGFQVVGNLASWYKGVKDNESCVQAVNLNDPFFQHRDVRFVLDLEAKEIFEDLVNYVTVNVKKPRLNAAEFNDSLTIDSEYLKAKGIAASLSYARGDEKDSEVYQYQTQWSLKGGNLFPASPIWRKGNWEGVTLAPPVEKWFVEVEGDLDVMAASDIARVTVELHYPLFGQEKFSAFALSPRAGQPIVGQPIFVDRGTRGFAYRLIVHHERDGRMVVPCDPASSGRCVDGWRVGIGERYVFATLPEEILAQGDAREQAKLAAQKLGQLGSEKILNQFSELFASAQ